MESGLATQYGVIPARLVTQRAISLQFHEIRGYDDGFQIRAPFPY